LTSQVLTYSRPATSLSTLLQWRPIQALVTLVILTLAYPAVQMLRPNAAMANHTLDIAVEGAKGIMDEGQLQLDLPVAITNGSDRVIMRVVLWVRAYACPDEDTPTPECTKLLSTEQNLPLRLLPGQSANPIDHISSGLPDHIAGRLLRILRKLDRVEDDNDETDRLAEIRLNRL
jgi:hypothetical protein